MGALVSALLWMSGHSAGLSRRRLLAALGRIWAAMVACIAGLLLVRTQVGGGLVDYDSAKGTVDAGRIAGADLLWLLMGLVWVVVCLLVATRAAAVVTRRPPEAGAATDQTRE